MERKYILLLIIPRCLTVQLHQDCVTYPFEEEFDIQFSSVYKCPEKWKLGNYNTILLKSPHVLSRTFISPTNLLSCVVSYKFPMNATGIVEVNLYMDTVSSNDFISIEIYSAASGSDTVVGEKTISPLSPDFEIGWKTVEIPLSGLGAFNGYIFLKGKTNDGSVVLIDSFRYIPPLYDKELCKIYDNSVYDYTEFYDFTTVENTPDIQTITEQQFDITVGYSNEIHENNDYITHPDIAMNLLDTEFLNTPEQSTNIQTQELSDITEVVYITDTSQSAVMLNTELPATSQTILSTETSTHKTDIEWIDSKLLGTTVEAPKIEDETYASTLSITTELNYAIHSSTEQDTTTALPETLYDPTTNRDIATSFKTIYTNMPDKNDESTTSKANVMDTELTTKLIPRSSTEGSNIKTTTTKYVSFSTTLWDFLHPSISRTKGSEVKDTSEISSNKQNLNVMDSELTTTLTPSTLTEGIYTKTTANKDDIVIPLKRNKIIIKSDIKAIDIFTTTSSNEADDGTFARTLEVEDNLMHSTTELATKDISNNKILSNLKLQLAPTEREYFAFMWKIGSRLHKARAIGVIRLLSSSSVA
ncbi:PREDICTED: uncharacterized protein LOC106111514 [Papilio polytes]|uniref:uncharacterized protein LOC106111514 n=1 Tax=Papilio polytes TaxID=76194 RepID=UPI000675F81E|nr:PREDICTED: uncharacterized protein LOC106111514 [Papilio polytes]